MNTSCYHQILVNILIMEKKKNILKRYKQFQTTQSPIDRTVYIITSHSDKPHILDLCRLLQDNQMPYSIQKQKDSLVISPQNQFWLSQNIRRFIVTDNDEGIVRLGPYFKSNSMFVVGFPKLGPNPQNHYCLKAHDVIKKFKHYIGQISLKKSPMRSKLKISKSFTKQLPRDDTSRSRQGTNNDKFSSNIANTEGNCSSWKNQQIKDSYGLSKKEVPQAMGKGKEKKSVKKLEKAKEKNKNVRIQINSKASENGTQSNKTEGKRCSRNTLSSQQTFSNDEMPIKSIWYQENEHKEQSQKSQRQEHMFSEKRHPISEMNSLNYQNLLLEKHSGSEQKINKLTQIMKTYVDQKISNFTSPRDQPLHPQPQLQKKIINQTSNVFEVQIKGKSGSNQGKVSPDLRLIQSVFKMSISGQGNPKQSSGQSQQSTKKVVKRLGRSESLDPKIYLNSPLKSFIKNKSSLNQNKLVPEIIHFQDYEAPRRPSTREKIESVLDEEQMKRFLLACSISYQHNSHIWHKGENRKINCLVNQLINKNIFKGLTYKKLSSPFQNCLIPFIREQMNKLYEFGKICKNKELRKQVLMLIDEENIEKWIQNTIQGINTLKGNQGILRKLKMQIIIINKTNSCVYFEKKLEAIKNLGSKLRPCIDTEITGLFLKERKDGIGSRVLENSEYNENPRIRTVR